MNPPPKHPRVEALSSESPPRKKARVDEEGRHTEDQHYEHSLQAPGPTLGRPVRLPPHLRAGGATAPPPKPDNTPDIEAEGSKELKRGKRVGSKRETYGEEKVRGKTLDTTDFQSFYLKSLGLNLAGVQEGGLSTSIEGVAPVVQEGPAEAEMGALMPGFMEDVPEEWKGPIDWDSVAEYCKLPLDFDELSK